MKNKLISLILFVSLTAGILTACGQSSAPAATAAPTETAAPASEPEQPATDKVAGASDMTTVEEVVEDGMVPVTAEQLKDGTYPVEMRSSSSMFKVDSCDLIVADGRLQAVLNMSSEAYTYLYPGTAEEAAAADPSAYITPVENSDGTRSFTLPISALDSGISCAAFSGRKEMWYDRTLLFRADALPLDAFAAGAFATPDSLALADGSYTVEVALTGGSGKASVQSPATLTVQDGSCIAEIVWGSPNYDYMIVAGDQYLPVNTEGNSTFHIPVLVFDHGMPVIADTTAMSQPYEIEYTLLFDSETIEPAA